MRESDSKGQQKSWQTLTRELDDLSSLVSQVIKQRHQESNCTASDYVVRDLTKIRHRISKIKTSFGSDSGEDLEYELEAEEKLRTNRDTFYTQALETIVKLGCNPDVQHTVRYLLELVRAYIDGTK